MDLRSILSNPMELQSILTSAPPSPDREHYLPTAVSSVPQLQATYPSLCIADDSLTSSPDLVETEYFNLRNNNTESNKGEASSSWVSWDEFSEKMHLPHADTLVEQRRRKNRANMRRSRWHQRDLIAKMKQIVVQLEQKHKALLDFSSERPAEAKQDVFAQMVAQVKQLSAENVFLRASIQQQQIWKQRLCTIFECEQQSTHQLDTDTLIHKQHCMRRDEAAAIFRFYHHLTIIEANKIIVDHTRTIRKIHERLLLDGNQTQFARAFDWDVRRCVDGSEMVFMFTKRFEPSISTVGLLEDIWECIHRFRDEPMQRPSMRDWKILQWLNNDIVVLGSDIRPLEERTVFRTICLRYRTEITTEKFRVSDNCQLPAKIYRVGLHSINPDLSNDVDMPLLVDRLDENEQLQWADLTLSMDLLTAVDPITQQEYVELRWSGKTNYKSERIAYRDAADALSNLLRWELAKIGPVLNIFPSSTRMSLME